VHRTVSRRLHALQAYEKLIIVRVGSPDEATGVDDVSKSTLNARPAHHHPSKSVVLIYRVLDPTHIHHMCTLIIK
jgi:hypothetical protein